MIQDININSRMYIVHYTALGNDLYMHYSILRFFMLMLENILYNIILISKRQVQFTCYVAVIVDNFCHFIVSCLIVLNLVFWCIVII